MFAETLFSCLQLCDDMLDTLGARVDNVSACSLVLVQRNPDQCERVDTAASELQVAAVPGERYCASSMAAPKNVLFL